MSAAVCWGEDAATHRQHHRHRQSVPGVFVSAQFETEGGTDLILVSNIESPVVKGTVAFTSTPIMGYLNTPV